MRFSRHPLHRGDYIGFAAFGGVVLGSFSSYIFRETIVGEPWQLVLTFVLGGLFLILGVLSHRFIDENNGRECFAYFAIQAVLCLGCIWVSPIRGFFGILPLPLASQAVFFFSWKRALLGGFFLYFMTSMVYYPDYGWQGFWEAVMAYSPGYLFTIGFSFITVDAVRGRIRAAQLSTDLETANTQLRAHAAQAEELATTRERNRLAREIHDGVGHYLTVINIQLEAARAVFTSDPTKAQQAVEKATRLSKEALDDVRRSVGSLRTEQKRATLPEALKNLTTDAGLAVNLVIDGETRPLSSKIEHALFRATQEGLTNVRKHARTDRAKVHLDFRELHEVKLSISDEGSGPNGATANSGYGLKGMHERIELLGGSVHAAARPEGGFQVNIAIPV